jgi:hypothetical protein
MSPCDITEILGELPASIQRSNWTLPRSCRTCSFEFCRPRDESFTPVIMICNPKKRGFALFRNQGFSGRFWAAFSIWLSESLDIPSSSICRVRLTLTSESDCLRRRRNHWDDASLSGTDTHTICCNATVNRVCAFKTPYQRLPNFVPTTVFGLGNLATLPT